MNTGTAIKESHLSTEVSMRLVSAAALFMCVAATVPTVCQQTSNSGSGAATSAATPSSSAKSSDPIPDHAALRTGLEQQNKLLEDQVEQQRTILKLNQALIKETEKLDDANKRWEDEKAKVAALNAELEKRREALKSAQQSGGATVNPSSASDSTVAQNTTATQN
jgi:flagellar motility protein MotE (MotC chaperone)